MNVVLHCCQMQNPQGGLGVRIKAFEEVKTDEKLYIFIRSQNFKILCINAYATR